MALIEGLDITCRTTCGCGYGLVPYTKQKETTHYLLTCKPYSDRYNHPLLIAIDKNSPMFKNARQWNKFWNELCVNFDIDDINWNDGDFESEWFVVRANKDRQIVKNLQKWEDELRTILEFSKETYPEGDNRKTTNEIYIKVLNMLGRRNDRC